MQRLLAAAFLAAALVAAVPTAQAQQGLTLTVDDLATPVPFSGSSAMPFTLVIGCLDVLTSGGAMTVTVAPSGTLPAWLTATPQEIDVDPMACLQGQGTHTVAGSVPIAVTADAPGVIEHTLALMATLGSSTAEGAGTFTVAYNWDYTVVPDVTFPLTMTTPTVSFNLTVTQSSNARSMVMMEEVQASSGVIAGLTSTVYENDAGKPDSKTFLVTYTAPTGDWESAKVNFMAYGHYLLLDSRSGDYDEGIPVEWTFTNGGIKTEGDKGKDAPAPVAPLLALGLVALAAFARRRA